MRFSARSLVNTTDFNNNWQHTLNLTVPSDTGNALTMSLQITIARANLASLPMLYNAHGTILFMTLPINQQTKKNNLTSQ